MNAPWTPRKSCFDLFVVDSCCCGCDLKTGSIMLLILAGIYYFAAIVISAASFQWIQFVACLVLFTIVAVGLYGAVSEKATLVRIVSLATLVTFVIGVIAFAVTVIVFSVPNSVIRTRCGSSTTNQDGTVTIFMWSDAGDEPLDCNQFANLFLAIFVPLSAVALLIEFYVFVVLNSYARYLRIISVQPSVTSANKDDEMV
jgi:hypothetical protein